MARAPKITRELIENLLRDGVGQGHGEDYKPILRIRRWNPSKNSTQVVGKLSPFNRSCHFFCRSEWLLGLLFAWIGAYVREQYPAWPWPHRHPGYVEDEYDSSLPWSEGLIEVLRGTGIEHGEFVGTNIPYIWNLDLMLTLPWVSSENKSVIVSVKPLKSDRFKIVDPLDRAVEKLEGERLYAKSLNIPYFIGCRSLYPGPMLGQLEWTASAAKLPINDHRWEILQRFLERREQDLQSTPPTETINILQKDFSANKEEADYLMSHMIWNQIVDVDVSKYLDYSKVPIPGGRSLINAIRESIAINLN